MRIYYVKPKEGYLSIRFEFQLINLIDKMIWHKWKLIVLEKSILPHYPINFSFNR